MSESIKLFILSAFLWLGISFFAGVVQAAEMDDYQRSFDAYRQSYLNYEVKQTDFLKSQTFASEEGLTNAAREMLLLRSDSWSNYWKTVSASYSTVSSSSEDKKNTWKEYFEAEDSWLSVHKQGLVDQKTRKGLLEEASRLNQKNQTYMSKAFEINIETISGRMKDAIIQVRKLNDELLLKVKGQNIELAKQDLAARGLESNLERLNQLDTDLEIIKKDFMNQSGYVNNEQFATINQDFIPLHQKLSQITSNTRELSKDIQW